MATTEDTTSSSDKIKSDEPIIVAGEVNEPEQKRPRGKGRPKNKTQSVVYGGDHDDFSDIDFNDDFDDHDDYPVVDINSKENGETQGYDGNNGESDEEGYDESEEGHEPDMGEEMEEKPDDNYFEDNNEVDDMWEDEEDEYEDEEDEEELERQRQEAYEAALLAAEEERERIRNARLAEIMKKKEVLVERYLRVARIMIRHRKKNIYLQDYLYHLALRKGVLRGDSQMNTIDSVETDPTVNQALDERLKKRNSIMGDRFADFLRKTGHFYEEESQSHHHHKHHHHHHHRTKSTPNFNDHPGQGNFHRRLQSQNAAPKTEAHKSTKTCPDAQEGKECPSKQKTKSVLKTRRHERRKQDRNSIRSRSDKSTSRSTRSNAKGKPRTLAEILERKAAAALHRLMKTANVALDAFEKHRCKLMKKKQVIKIAKLLEKQYSGISPLEKERAHLVSFVEQSVKAESAAKKKAFRRQQKSISQNKKGIVNLNHQWTKSLERIRELRLKKVKMEQEHKLVLLQKVKHWHVWEKRDKAAIGAVYEFVGDLGSRVSMSKGESLSFHQGLEQFQKQLHSLHETMLKQVIRMFKAENVLQMTQRRAKDNTSVAAPVAGFTISDYERMIIENQESHNKLVERQKHLMEQYEKLKKYVHRVAESHLNKQRSWGALRTGRHDMKQLWELCLEERDNLLHKLKEIRLVQRLHRRLFVQISVLENKRLFKDYQRVNHQVAELKDKERELQTQLHQTQSLLRVLNAKLEDTQLRKVEADKESAEKVIKESMQFSKETIKERINPRVPNTIYNVNIPSKRSQKRLIAQEKAKQGPTTPTKMEQNRKSVLWKKLPQI